jgi:cobalt-zinc-cadmium efflux system outer membrane protein
MILLVVLSLSLQQGAIDTLTIAEALELARSHHPAVRVAGANVARARAGLRVAGTIPNPVGGYSYTEDTPRQHLSFEQSFDWLLTRGQDRAAAGEDIASALADSTQTAADLVADVQTAFYGAIAADAVAALTRDQLVLADSIVAIARERLARGDIPLLEQERLALEAVRSAQRHARAEEAAEVARGRLALAIGWRNGTPLPALSGTLADGLTPTPAGEPDSTVLTPRIRVALHDSAAFSFRARSAARAGIPLPTVQAGADWDDPTVSHTPLAVLGFTLPLPLWQHGGGAAAAAQAEAARSSAALAQVRAAESQRLAETSTRLHYAEQRALVARDSLLPLARRVRERAALAYQAGESGVTELLDALRAERDVSAEAVDDLLTWQEARAAWRQARGYSE